jgi:predicted MFS family arabinose efflux permease
MAAMSSSFSNVAEAFRQRNFRLYVSGNSVSLVGLWIQRIAVGWLTWELTHSGAWLGAIALADLCPSLLIGPFAGVIADRLDRLRIMRVLQTLAMIQSATLALLAAGGWIDIGILMALVLVNGVIVGVYQPARLALVSSLVPRSHLATAVAINSIVFNLARFVGPALGGLLILSVGVAAAFAANAASYLAFLLALARIRLDSDALPAPAANGRSVFADVAEGIHYIAGHAGIGPLLLLTTVLAAGVQCYFELLPGFAAEVFSRGAGGLALLASAVGVGAVAGGLWLARRGNPPGLARVSVRHGVFAALAVLGFAATEWFPAGLFFAAASGAFMAISKVSAQSLIQLAVDPKVRGRVLSLYGIIVRAGPAAGAMMLGGASELVGLRPPLVAGAMVCVIVGLYIWRRRAQMEAALEHRVDLPPGTETRGQPNAGHSFAPVRSAGRKAGSRR